MSNQPYVEEARRRVAEFREENKRPNANHYWSDDEIIQLMADYAAESWQEGYDEGWDEGFSEGEYEQQEKDG